MLTLREIEDWPGWDEPIRLDGWRSEGGEFKKGPYTEILRTSAAAFLEAVDAIKREAGQTRGSSSSTTANA